MWVLRSSLRGVTRGGERTAQSCADALVTTVRCGFMSGLFWLLDLFFCLNRKELEIGKGVSENDSICVKVPVGNAVIG